MHRSLVAAVSAAALTLVLVASSVALVPSLWIPMEVSAAQVDEGQRLFDHETFGGNGRTCRTCHSGAHGTIALKTLETAFGRTRPTRFSFMTAWTIFSAARRGLPPTQRS